ncbi:MAG: DUF3298 and DUF4163 domain-containing protein [Fimbriimonadaceae bacterium]|nr:DUF3298 and DUF4163 domain-containing protein [Fimbriimonadaceae bacterium]
MIAKLGFFLALVLATGFIADYETVEFQASNTGCYVAKVSYLKFAESHPLASIINPALLSVVTKSHLAWVKNAKDAVKELGKPTSPWEQEITVEAVRSTPRLVSLSIATYDYSGGAHPNHGVQSMNFGFIAGKPKQLTLTDFFAPGFDSRGHVSKLIIERLKQTQGAEWVKEGQVTSLNTEMAERFVVNADGLTWTFNPYEVGPYASGDFEVKLNLNQLGPKFKRSLLLGR